MELPKNNVPRSSQKIEESSALTSLAPIKIVQLEPHDWQVYKKIRLRALKEDPLAFGSTYSEMVAKDDGYWKKKLDESTSGAKNWILFAKKNEQLVGTVVAHLGDQEKAQVHGVFVAREARGLGIGELLMSELLSLVSQNSQIKKIYLDVNAEQVAAVSLYKKLGFQVADEIEEKLGDGKQHKVYVMYKELTASIT